MDTLADQLKTLFAQLNHRIEEINTDRRSTSGPLILKCKVTLLGQLSLLVNEQVSAKLSLTQTADMDALLEMEAVVQNELKKLLLPTGFIYDEDSYLIWIPPGAKFNRLFS